MAGLGSGDAAPARPAIGALIHLSAILS